MRTNAAVGDYGANLLQAAYVSQRLSPELAVVSHEDHLSRSANGEPLERRLIDRAVRHLIEVNRVRGQEEDVAAQTRKCVFGPRPHQTEQPVAHAPSDQQDLGLSGGRGLRTGEVQGDDGDVLSRYLSGK